MNDLGPAAPMLCLVVFFILLVVAIGMFSHSMQRSTLDAVARRFNGRVEQAGLFGYDRLIVTIGDVSARITFTKRGKKSRNTHLTVSFPDPQLRMELYAQNLVQQLRKLLGMHDIEIGSRGFDDAFLMNGSNPALIREYLNAPAQAAIIELARFGTVFAADLHLSINGSMLRVTKHSWLSSEGELTQFISLCEVMYHALAYARNSGIEFVAGSPPTVAQETECQVCGEPLTGKIVYCASCQTPHHLDCWQYFESCAVYGCGQKRYREPRRNA